MRNFTLAEGMALVWRLSIRRAGRRTLATLAGVGLLWLLAVMVLPSVLPPSSSPHAALPPAHRRIHQQADADYTGQKQAHPRKGDKNIPLKQDLRAVLSPSAGNTKETRRTGLSNSEKNLNRTFPMKERGESAVSISSSDVQQQQQGVGLRPGAAAVNPDKNVVFAPLKPLALADDEDNTMMGDDPDAGVQDAAEEQVSAALQKRGVNGSSHVAARREAAADSAVSAAGDNAAEEVDSNREVVAIAAGSAGGLVQDDNGNMDSAENSEGPYTLPILKAPKDGAPTAQKRGGYLSRLAGGHHPAAPSEVEADDVGEGSVQAVIPLMVAKGAFRGIGGVFPIHPVEYMHPGGMMGDVAKDQPSAASAQEKAQIIAMAAIEHGHKITQQQQDMIDKLSPNRKKQLAIRTKEMRQRQEKAYLLQLRTRRQIVPAEGGGEKIVSTARMTIRFPPSLKKLHPEDWPPEYKVYLNITHSPWSADSGQCERHVTRFTRPHSLPTRAIASFPSSGNTWIRYLIEGATGIYTGSLYDDSSLTRKGMYGEAVAYDSGLTLLQKTHGYTTGLAMKEDHQLQLQHNHFKEIGCRGLVIVRNPFKALISHRHLDIGGHTGYAPKSQFQGPGWAEFVELKIKLWESFYTDWLQQCPSEDVFITHYEVLKSDLTTELTRILEFLHVPIDKHRVDCVQSHSDGLFKRKPSKNVPHNVDYYPKELKNKIYAAIDRLNAVLEQKGKNALPIAKYEMYDEVEAKIARYQIMKLKKQNVP